MSMGKKTVKKVIKKPRSYMSVTTSTTTTGGWDGASMSKGIPRENFIGLLSVIEGKLVLKTDDKIIPIDNIEEIKKIVAKTLLKQEAGSLDQGTMSAVTFDSNPNVVIKWNQSDPSPKWKLPTGIEQWFDTIDKSK